VLETFLDALAHTSKSLFCVPTLVFIDHTPYLHTTKTYHRCRLEELQMVNCVWEFVFTIIVVLCLVSDLGHVFRLNVKDNVGDGFRVLGSRRLSRELSLCPIKYLFVVILWHGIIDSNWYKIELSSVHRMGSIRMGLMEVSNNVLGVGDVGHGFPSLFFSQVAFPMDKVLHFASLKSQIPDEFYFIA
jgi:hypothetical protein